MAEGGSFGRGKRKQGFLTSTAKKRIKQAREKARAVARVYIKDEIVRWQAVKREVGAGNDEDVAKILLDCWQEKHRQASLPFAPSTSQATSTPLLGTKNLIKEQLTLQVSSIAVSSDSQTTLTAESGVDPIFSNPNSCSNPDSDPLGLKDNATGDVTFCPYEDIWSEDEDDEDEEEEEEEEEEEDEELLSENEESEMVRDAEELDRTYADEIVFDLDLTGSSDSQDEEYDPKSDVGVPVLTDPGQLLHEKASIAYEGQLRKLAHLQMPSGCRNCGKPYHIQSSTIGTSFYLTWKCSQGHLGYRWASQPKLHTHGIHAGDFQLATNILLSGNNFRKVSLMFKFMNIGCISQTFFDKIQHYAVPCVDNFYCDMIQEVREKLKKRGKPVVLAGDGRNDSPGHSAEYLNYTTLEHDTKDLVGMEIVEKREVGLKSPNMERLGLERVLKSIQDDGLKVSELVTDAHVQIASMMSKEHSDIQHQWDVWHGAKNLGKKITAAGQERGKKALLEYVRDATNHFWYCAEKAEGSKDMFLARWRGFVHVVDKHEWLLGDGGGPAKCEHDELPAEGRDKAWLESGSPEHIRLSDIILDRKLLKDSAHYVNFRHTGELETFHTHLLMYATKRISFTFPVYRARCRLAAIDYQQHKDRQYITKENGETRYKRTYCKTSGKFSVVPVKENKTYAYIVEIQRMIIQSRLDDPLPLHRKRPLEEDDPRRISKTLAPSTPPPTSVLVATKKSRFKSQ